MLYNNYGDVNFFDTGRLVKRIGQMKFEIITCDYDNDMENHYLISTGTININEIDKDDLMDVCRYANDIYPSQSNIDSGDVDLFRLALDCFEYQNQFAFDLEQKWMTKNEVIDWIDHGYINEIEWEFYKANFYEDNRNVVAKIYNNYGQSSRQIYNSLKDALEDFESECEKGWSIEIEDM